MSVAAEHGITGRAASTTPPVDAAPGCGQVPRLAEGVELLGEYQNSGYSQPPSLIRRLDGQVIQMSPLLYRVICWIDGSRGPDAIAERVSEDLGRSLNADQVRYLITAKLLPLGIVVVAEGTPAAAPKADPLLALRARGTLLPERAANVAGTLLRPLFRWPVVVALVGLGYLLLYLPQINRALWLADSRQAHLVAAALAGHRHAMAAVDMVGVALVALSLAGSIYIVMGLARRLTTVGLRWSAGRPGRRLLFALAGLACLAALAVFWNAQGQFRGW